MYSLDILPYIKVIDAIIRKKKKVYISQNMIFDEQCLPFISRVTSYERSSLFDVYPYGVCYTISTTGIDEFSVELGVLIHCHETMKVL